MASRPRCAHICTKAGSSHHTVARSDSSAPAYIHPAMLFCSRAACNMPITARSVSSSTGVGEAARGMTMTMVVAPSPFCACACASRCCRLAVAAMAMATMMTTTMLRVRWWLPAHAGAQPGRRRAVRACTRVRRGGCMVGARLWRASRLAGSSSRPNDPSRSAARVRVSIPGLVRERRRAVASGWPTAFRGL